MTNFAIALSLLLMRPQHAQYEPIPSGMAAIEFMQGDWSGKQVFVTPGITTVGDVTDHVKLAIGKRYVEETLSTTMPGREPTDTRHFISYDPKTAMFKAWWFNDTALEPTELVGTAGLNVLTLVSQPKSPQKPVLRATYQKVSNKAMTFKLEMKMGEGWRELFTSSYTKP